MEPVTVGNYRIVRALGQGGLSAVYEGVAPDGRRVAIKSIAPSSHDSERLRALLLREASVLRRVASRDPAFVEVYDVVLDDHDQLYLIRELVEGVELSEWQLGRSSRQVIALYTKIASALAALHEAQVAFRDLKPDNVLVDAAGNPRIIDFGLAVLMDQPDALTGAGTLIGTVLYLAPEAVRGEKVDSRADIFAFGTMLLEALLGRHPRKLEQGGVASLLRDVMQEVPKAAFRALRWTEAAPLNGIILAMLSIDPERRPSAHEVVQALRDWSHGFLPAQVSQVRVAGPEPDASLSPVALSKPPPRGVHRSWVAPLTIGVAAATVIALALLSPNARPILAWLLAFGIAAAGFAFVLRRFPRDRAVEQRIRALEKRLESGHPITSSIALGAEQIKNTFDDADLERVLRQSLIIQLENPTQMDPARALLVMQALRSLVTARDQPSVVARLTPWVSLLGTGTAALVAGTGLLSSMRLLDFDDPPVIHEFRALAPKIVPGGELDFEVSAEDPEHRRLTYEYSTSVGAIRGVAKHATLYAPRRVGERSILVRVTVRDPANQEAIEEVSVRVNRPPRGQLVFNPPPAPGILTRVSVEAADGDGDKLDYQWYAEPSLVRRESPNVVYFRVPPEPGTYEIGCTVSDGHQSLELRRSF